MRGHRSGIAIAALAMAVTTATPARAGDPATAQALFDQGRKLMGQDRWAEACPKLEESQRLDPAGGTLLHLALCREHEGRIATAWALYQEALASAKRDGRKDRAKIAQERVDALGPRLPRLRVRIAPPNRKIDGFTVKRDDVIVGEAQWGEGLPVDPGAHTLSAHAKGRKTWTARVDVPPSPEEVILDIPELELQLETPAPVERPPPTPAPSRLDDANHGDGQRTAALIVGGVGIAGVVVGSIFGLVSFSKKGEADKECAPPDSTRCSAAGIEASDAGMRAGTVSTIAFIAGAALVAGGVALYFSAPTGRSVAITPTGLTARF
jgi:hypothetical protein